MRIGEEMRLKGYTDTCVLIDKQLKSNVECAYDHIINYTCTMLKFDRLYFPKFNYVIMPIKDNSISDDLILIKLVVKYDHFVCCSAIINNHENNINYIDYEFCGKHIIGGLVYFGKLKLKCELKKK